jgi:hypothetical protein
LLSSTWFIAEAQPHAQIDKNSARPRSALASGIFTDRISSRDLPRWSAIKRIVFANNARGRPLHPTLRGLWELLNQSGHAVYIEIRSSNSSFTNTAGAFNIERYDPLGIRHVAIIRLELSNIDRAYVGPSVARDNGFIPFKGLSKEERYAEVLGHELAHALWILSDPERTRKVEEMIEQTNKLFLSQRRRYGNAPLSPEMRRRIAKRDALLLELEEQAEAVEFLVWQELGRSRAFRTRSRNREILADHRFISGCEAARCLDPEAHGSFAIFIADAAQAMQALPLSRTVVTTRRASPGDRPLRQ